MVVSARHRLYVANNIPTLTRNIHDETRVCCLRKIWILFSARNKQCKLSATCAGDKPFMTVDHPFISIFVRKCFDQRWIATSHFRFGHGEARTHATFTQRTQILFFLLRRSPMQQRVLVALIGCLCVQHVWPNAHLCCFSRHCCHGCWTKPHAAPFSRHMRKPQVPVLASQFAQFNNGLHHLRTVILINCVPLRANLFVHEGTHF